MAYLALLIGFAQILFGDTKGMTTNQTLALGFQNAYHIQNGLFLLVLGTAIVATVFTILFLASDSGKAALGCTASLAILAWILVPLHFLCTKILENLAGSIDPTLGITDPTRFWILIVVILLIGAS